MRLYVCIGVCLASLAAAYAAGADTQPPTTTTPLAKPTGAGATTPAAPDQSSTELPTPSVSDRPFVDALDLSAQYTYLGISGNQYKFEQYGTPPQGLDIPRVWIFAGQPGTGYLAMDMVQPARGDQNLYFQLWSPIKEGQIRFFDKTWRDHPELNPLTVDRVFQGIGVNQPFLGKIALQAHYVERSFRPEQAGAMLPDRPNVLYPNYSLKGGDAGVFAPFGLSSLSIRQSVANFNDRTGYQPDNTTYQTTARAEGTLGQKISGLTSFSYTTIAVQDRNVGGEDQLGHRNIDRSVRVDVQGSPIDSLSLSGYATDLNSTREFNLSGYARDIEVAGVRAAWRGFPGLFVRTGYEARDINYTGFMQMVEDHPRVRTGFVAARYSPVRDVELTARLSSIKRLDLPMAPNPNSTVLEPAVTPTDTNESEFGASYTPNAYCGFTYRYDQNRDVNNPESMILCIRTQDLVAWAQPTPRLNLSASYGLYNYNGSVLLSPYLSNADVVGGALNYTVSSRLSVGATYTYTTSSGAASVGDRGLGASVNYQLSKMWDGSVELSNPTFRDYRNPNIYYETTGLMFRVRRKIQ